MMTHRPRKFPIFAALVAAAVPSLLPAQDSVEDVLRRGYELPLRWDNVEGAPEWVSGEKPQYDLRSDRHAVGLEPGESTCVHIPAYELLRVVGPGEKPLAPGDLDIALSTGSGLLAFTEPVPDADGHSLLVDPRRPYPMLAHVMRPRHCEGAIPVGLFTSRHVPLSEVVSYRDLIDLGEPGKVRMTTSVESEAPAFWRWDRGSKATLRARGPARFLLQTRYRYPPDEQKLPQTYRIHVRDEESGTQLASVEYATSHETAHLVLADGEVQVVSRLEPGFFELPDDRDYSFTLETSAPVFVRLLRMEEDEYLLHSLNAPDPSPGEVADDLRGRRFQQSPWELPEAELREVLAIPLRQPAEQVERAAIRLARDNTRREGGMMASGLLWNAGAPRRDYPDIRERWREFVGFRTYYRDALPEGVPHAGLERAYFPARRLQAIGKHREWLVLGDQHIDAGLSRLPLATFSPIDNGRATSIYRLPLRSTHSIVRITAERERERDQAVDFWLRLSDCDTRRFRLLPHAEVPWEATKPPQAEAALDLIDGDTLDAAAALRREPNDLVPAGYFEFLVPPHVREIEIWNAGGAEQLPVAVQYRASDVFELAEDEYGSVVAMLGKQSEIFKRLVEFLSDADLSRDDSLAGRELANHWEPLHRFVRSRYRQFVDSVAPEGRLSAGAERLQETDRLIGAGEYYLAERLARYLYLYAEKGTTRDGALRRLDEIAQRHLDPERQVMNACVAMVVQPGEAKAAELCRLLRQQGEPELALMLALALPPDKATRELRLACTFVKGWWAQFAMILEEDAADPNSRVWYAHRLWRLGQLDEARREFEAAGDAGAAWLDHIDATQQARRQVVDGEPGGIANWARSETTNPAPRVWQTINHERLRSFQAGVTVRALEREKYFHAFIATPDHPVEIDFASPRKLRIECRPIHDAQSGDPIEGWVLIEEAGAAIRKLPVISNYRSPGLEIVGRDQQQPGTLVWDEFGISGWNTRLKVRPDSGAMLVRVLSAQPEVRTGHLPPLGYETAGSLFAGASRAPRPADPGFGSALVINAQHEVIEQRLGAPFAEPDPEQLANVRQLIGGLAPIGQPLARQSQRDSIVRMTERLWEREQPDAQFQRAAIAAASAQLAADATFPELGRVHAKIVRRAIGSPC